MDPTVSCLLKPILIPFLLDLKNYFIPVDISIAFSYSLKRDKMVVEQRAPASAAAVDQ